MAENPNGWSSAWKQRVLKERKLLAGQKKGLGAKPPASAKDALVGSKGQPLARSRTSSVPSLSSAGSAVLRTSNRVPSNVGSIGKSGVRPGTASTDLTSISRRPPPSGSGFISFSSLTSSALQLQVEGLVKQEVERELERVIEPLKEQLSQERANRLIAEGKLAKARLEGPAA
jgi:hypothetical protein